ncbi:MAG TPA: aspartyl protease family protein [Arenimonas sp.]|nr:aspartyl protease family protein [Arenimonas sp.]
MENVIASNKRRRRGLEIAALLVATALCSGASALPNKTQSDPVSALVDVPIRTDFGLPLVELEIRGAKGSERGLFILDTGFGVNIIDAAWAAKLGVSIDNPQKVLQPGGEVEMGAVPELKVRIGEMEVSGQSAHSAPLAQLRSIVGLPVRGLIGHDLLDDYVVRIQYQSNRLQLFPIDADFSSLEPDAGWGEVPVEIRDGEVLAGFSIRQADEVEHAGQIKVDTGSITGLGFALNFYEDAQLQRTAPDYRTTGGIGAGGETEGRLFRVDALRFAGRNYEDVPAGVTMAAAGTERRDNAGTLGAPILARQDLVLDYAKGRILFGPEYAPNSPIADDMSGLWLVTNATDFSVIRVHQVLDGSPAQDSGVKAGDRVLSIDGVEASQRSLSQWRQRLQGPVGESVRVRYERGGKARDTEFKLKSLYKKAKKKQKRGRR